MLARLAARLLLLLLLLLQGCFGTQTWNQEPSRTEVNPEGNVVLACKVYNKQGTCSWQKDGKPQGMFVGKYEWSGDRGSGDCSIRILDAGEVDDGEWECQVTASAFAAHDALTSRIAQLIVRVAPKHPVLEVDSQPVSAGQNFTVQEDRPGSIKCLSRYGNPPAEIKWFIGDEELPASESMQTNMTEMDKHKTWMAVSILRHTFSKADHNTPLRCVAIHQAYQTKSQAVEVLMDVQYAPTVTLEGAPTEDIEEGVDDVVLRCIVDSNPGANVVWRVKGQNDVFSFQPEVRFSPASRKHSGTYTCEARNPVGGSDPISVNIDVKYRPRDLKVGPAQLVTATLHNHTLLECFAEANPPPRYTWIQTIPDTQETVVRGHNSTLLLEDVTYEHQGEYVCVASSVIREQPTEERSQPIIVEVVGAPQVLRYTVERNVQVEKGQDAVIQIVFCSDPRPSSTSWEWGSLRLEAGNGRGRYVAENLAQDAREDCYSARLRVQGADVTDSRDYILNVQNEKGADRYAVELRVNEPVSMSTVIGIVIACLVILVLVTLIVLYAFKTEKWCFSQRGDFKPTDLESDKSDLESQKGTNGRNLYSGPEAGGGRAGGRTPGSHHPSIPPDALYTTRPKRTTPSMSSKPDHEYENLKIMPTQTATPSSCQEMRSSSSSSTNSSCNQQKRDELTTAAETGELEEKRRKMEEKNEEQVGMGGDQKEGSSTGYSQSDMLTFKRQDIPQDEARDTSMIFNKSHQYVPVYRPNPERRASALQDRVISGSSSHPRRPSSGAGVIYAELQLPRTSNNGSMRRGEQRRPKTQYAEITFQGRPLQTAEI